MQYPKVSVFLICICIDLVTAGAFKDSVDDKRFISWQVIISVGTKVYVNFWNPYQFSSTLCRIIFILSNLCNHGYYFQSVFTAFVKF